MITRRCQCGCGQSLPPSKVPVNPRTGLPIRFIKGHGGRIASHAVNTAADVVGRYVVPGPASACWPWRGARDNKGYGAARVAGRALKAHRVAYEVAHGPIPAGLIVRHTCDNPPCCNPAHLEVGTHADNARDKAERGRSLRGELASTARLTAPDVVAIRERLDAGEHPDPIASDYDVSRSAIRHIERGRTWRHVPETAERQVSR